MVDKENNRSNKMGISRNFKMALKRPQCLKIVSALAFASLFVFVILREKKEDSAALNSLDPHVKESSRVDRKTLSKDLDPKDLSGLRVDGVTEFQEKRDEEQRIPLCRPLAPKDDSLRMIYMITPTYRRGEQLPELIRTGQTLLHVPNLKWIVVEDALEPTPQVDEYLRRSGLDYVLLTAQMPSKYSKVKNKPRGVANRNKGLEWVRDNAQTGVVYFADDDNTYDIRVFEEMRSTKMVSVFPVGLVAKKGVSSPIIKNGRVEGFFDGWIAGRKFPLDMAGFAVSVELLQKKKDVVMPFKVGYEEDYFLQRLGISVADLEPKASYCTKIMVWHTQTKKNDPLSLSVFDSSLSNTNMDQLKLQVWTK